MEYYIVKDNRSQGPLSLEYLKENGLLPETRVWREGLDGWTAAKNVPELAEAIRNAAPPPVGPPDGTERAAQQKPPMPKTWLAESIIVTLLCCLPFGIVALIYSTQVESNYIMGNYDMAQMKSSQAKNMILWGIGCGAACVILYVVFLVSVALIGR